MARPIVVHVDRPLLGLLFRTKMRSLRNRIHQTIDQGPLRVMATSALMLVVWLGLYLLFHLTFSQLRRTPLQATVAIPLVFNFFFAVMLMLLTFSNAIIAYGSLFGRDESAYLLSSPVPPKDFVTLKYFESLLLASWSLILLGIPLMLAMADMAEDSVFYILFLAFFVAFIPIPGALGLFLAWAAARFFPRRIARTGAVACGLVIAILLLWGLQSLRFGGAETEAWLRSFYSRMSIIEAALLPNNWVATGIDHALNGNFSEALLYLGVTAANALFLSWLAVMIVSRWFDVALNRAATGRGTGKRSAAPASGGAAGLIFAYLPLPLRLVAAKDLRTFLRDPMQWSQLLILFALLGLYLANMPSLRTQLGDSGGWSLVIPFLNLCTLSLILATFTCRFVFPLVSLEGQKLWVIGLLPARLSEILLAKFAFAMTVTLFGAIGAMIVAAIMLELDLVWTVIHLMVTISICVALCGCAVGIGARVPMFHEPKIARIANGFGGTINLLASLGVVSLVLVAMGYATLRSRDLRIGDVPDILTLLVCLVAVAIGVGGGVFAMRIGAKHFDKIEV